MSGRDETRRRRRLSADEIDLWLKVAATVERRPGAHLPDVQTPTAPEPQAPAAPPRQLVHHPAAQKSAPALPKLAPLERGVKRKLLRGRIAADAAIDLHGYRQAEAHVALRVFLRESQARGARVVLVVTGKGGRAKDVDLPHEAGVWGERGIGVLKRMVPMWLAHPEFRDLVVGFEDAGPVHGGTGALYVRLRRAR